MSKYQRLTMVSVTAIVVLILGFTMTPWHNATNALITYVGAIIALAVVVAIITFRIKTHAVE